MKVHVFDPELDLDLMLARRRHSLRILVRDDDKLARLVEEELSKPTKQPEPEAVTA